ncbi:MAG: phosphoglycerate dehydrogenase [Christensenellales bacterium]|jgi:D-3-phosphoglycerate dehydrogenase
MKLKVAMSFPDEYVNYVRDAGFDVTPVEMLRNDEAESIEKLKGFSAVAAGLETFNANVLEALKGDLKIIVRHGIGYDRVDIEKAAELGICCCNTPGAMSTGVAEQTVCFMLEMTRKFYKVHEIMAAGGWDKGPITRQFQGSTVGLVGFGNIAQMVAKYLSGFGVDILAYDIRFNEEAAQKYNVKPSTLEEIAEKSDFVSVHTPLLPSTAKIINADFLKKMKNSAFLINTSRGGTVDEAALIAALENGEIAGAALDVFEIEPTPADNPLRKMDNVFLNPHMATHTFECIQYGFDGIIKCFKEFEAGQVPEFCLNPGYAENAR